MKGFSYYFERAVVVAMQALLIVVITLAVIELWILIYKAVAGHWLGVAMTASDIESVPDLQRGMQRAFAGVLLVLLGLELMDTMKAYFTEHRVRVEVILIVATIAVGRHIIQLDFEHTTGPMLFGIAALVLALTAGYFLVRRSLARDQNVP